MRLSVRRFAGALCLLAAMGVLQAAATAPAAAPVLAEDAPETYQVRSGDTLWDIAGRFLRDPWRWNEVWRANPSISDPDRIYPGDRLRLTVVDGQPRIDLERGDAVPTGYQDGLPVVRLSPRTRTEDLRQEVPRIPVNAIAPFLKRTFLADSDAIGAAPYVVGFPDEHLVAGLGDSVYVRRIDSAVDGDFEILRPGDPIRDPETNEILGYEAQFVGHATLERTGDPARLEITGAEREIAIGDRAVPAARDRPLSDFLPRPAPAGTKGQILSVLNGVTQIGQYDVVILNRGERDRLEPGHLFEIHVGGDTVRDQVRSDGVWNWRGPSPLSGEFWYGTDHVQTGWRRDEPDPNTPLPLHADIRRQNSTYVKPLERAGLLMVFRTFDRVSLALVLNATRALRVNDRVLPPPA